jgi:ribosomal protein S18 acetylase RimI-like enzyme
MDTTRRNCPQTPAIEIASHEDIVDAATVYQAASEALSDQLRARNPWANREARTEDLRQAIRVLSSLRAENPRSVVVARQGGEVVGIAAVRIQDFHAHIAFFFVHPEVQNRGVGRRLMEQLWEVMTDAGTTVTTLASSRDPRAWQRYLRLGLYPGPPQLPFRAVNPTFPDEPPRHDGLVARDLTVDDVERVAALDRIVRGVQRRERIGQWLAEGSEGVVVCEPGGELAGYALVTRHQHHGQIGPVAARTTEVSPFVMAVALHRAGVVQRSGPLPWRIDLPGRNHLAIAPLLDAGFSAENMVTWFESETVGQWDRYIFRDEDDL